MSERKRILRVVARLNVGGPAIHVTLATAGLDPARYETRLLAGTIGEREGDMSPLAREKNVRVETVPGLGRDVRAIGDFRALAHLTRVIREWKPHIVHTHTAKAGTLGRIAVSRAGTGAKRVHTFHGHVLSGYFGRMKSGVYRAIERSLAKRTDALVVPGAHVRDELLALGVGRPEQYEVVPLGFELAPFLDVPARARGERGALRESLNLRGEAVLAGIVGRLTAIKDHELMIDALAKSKSGARLVVIGDGELRAQIEFHAMMRGVSARIHFAGWRTDLPAIYRDLDFVTLSSRNEGTPVALIEAAASGRAALSTRVGGVADVVDDEQTGLLVAPGDPGALAAAFDRLAMDGALRERLGNEGRARAKRWDVSRMLGDLDRLYSRL